MLDPLEPVVWRLIDVCPQIKVPRVTEILREDYVAGRRTPSRRSACCTMSLSSGGPVYLYEKREPQPSVRVFMFAYADEINATASLRQHALPRTLSRSRTLGAPT